MIGELVILPVKRHPKYAQGSAKYRNKQIPKNVVKFPLPQNGVNYGTH